MSRGVGEVDDRGKSDILSGRREVFGGRLLCLLLCSFEFAIDSDVGILVESGIALHAWLGLFAAPEDTEIVLKETDAPFESNERVVVFECMGYFLGCFDEFSVGDAGGRPGFREMVGIELQEATSAAWDTTDYDVFLVVAGFFEGTHGTPKHGDIYNRLKIAHSASVGSGNLGGRNKMANISS